MNKTLSLKVMKRSLLLLAAMLLGGISAQGQNYVFYNTSVGYIINNNGNLDVNTTFTPSAVWIASAKIHTHPCKWMKM